MTVTDLTAARNVQVADVYKAGRWAATLTRTSEGVTFAYDPGYLAQPGPPVATTLPLSETARTTPAGAVPPFFAGLLPEGRRLASLRRAVKTSADDELSLLLAVGRDPIGDVQVVAHGDHPTPAEPLVNVTRSFGEVRFADVLAEGGVVDPVALPGVQDKASAGVISLPVGRAGHRYLLKLDPPEYPYLVANEAFFLARATRAGIPAAAADIVVDADGRPGLLVRRFDRVPGPAGTVQPLACEDACQLLNRWPADKYNVTAEAALAALAGVCAARSVALRNAFRQLCFAWLTGNGDVHAKNLSVLATVEGEWRLAPAYDLPSTVPYGDRTLALSMGGRTRGLSRRHLLDFGTSVGLPPKVAERVLDDMLLATDGLADELRAGALPFDQRATADLVAELRHRRRQALP